MTCGLIKVSNSLPERQAAKLTLFAPFFQTRHICTCCFGTLASFFTNFLAPSPLLLFCMMAAWCSVLVLSTLSVSLMVSSSLCKVFFFSPVRMILLGVKGVTAFGSSSAFAACVF